MVGLHKLGIVITAIISLTLAALCLEILYLLWRRHGLRRRTHSDPGTHKQLLHFLCWKRKSRVEPQRNSPPTSSSSPPELAEQVIKWQCVHGPSRVLFTIKEEDREGLDSDNFSSAETVVKTKSVCYAAAAAESGGGDESVEEVEVMIDTTPFSTPCASPPYFTPSSSPVLEVGNGNGCLVMQTPTAKQEPLSKSRQDFIRGDVIQVDQVLS
ncbi:hypothetical protein QN277_021200 [Acacia crassicarpa]|uniref:Uncharacterized protein n=1 Tax=Acacia crassicarpa TaxID=499986 RepID=A0AAE1MT96_9FABA|nr:hypothetical protein QN277_021200 [Acacia crassicarpa]